MDSDFYVYGGFDVTVNAFIRISLIFNDGEYIVLFFVATVFGIFFGGLITIGQGLLGKSLDMTTLMSFFILVLFGMAVFKGLIMPKGTMHIYDPVVNRYQAVSGVPELIVFAARVTNIAERALTEVMDNGSAHPRSLQGGGVGLELLINSFRGEPLGHQAYIQKSIRQYVADCLPAAESLASYSFDLKQLKSDTADIKAELAKLVNPSVFTTMYSTADKVGSVMSCTDAWNGHLNPTLNSAALYEEYVEHVCAQSGFAIHAPGEGVMQMNRCKTILEDAQALVFDISATGSYRKFMQDIMLSKAIVSSLMQTPGSTISQLASKDITESGFSSQLVSEQWLPAIKAIVFGVVLGLMPILALFIVTPMVFKSVHMMFGLMVWLALWGVTDSVVHGIAMDQVISMTEGIKNMNMSLGALMMMPDQATKGLAILGKAQSMGVILSTFIAGVFFRISGYAFTQLSEKWSGDIDRIGDKAGHDVLDPINRVNTLQQQMDAQAKMTTMGLLGMESFGVANQMMTSAPYNQANSQFSALQNSGYSGHQAISGAGVFEGASQGGNRLAQDNFAADNFGGNLGGAGSELGKISRTMDLAGTSGKAQALQSVHADKSLATATQSDAFKRGVDRASSTNARAQALQSLHPDQTLVESSKADALISQVDKVASTGARADALQSVHPGKTLIDAAKGDAAISQTDRASSTQLRGDLANQITPGNLTDGLKEVGRFEQGALASRVNHYGHSGDYVDALDVSESRFAGEMTGLEKVGNMSGLGVERLAEFSGQSQGFAMAGTGKAYNNLSPNEVISGFEAHDLANAVDGTVVSNVAASEGYASTKDYVEAQKTLGRNEELANLINAQRLMGVMNWDEKDISLAKNGTSWEMALSGEQLGQMENAGMFTPMDNRYYDEGGLLNMNMAGDGSVVSVFAKTGNAEQVNDSLEVSRGLSLNEGSGQIGHGSFAYVMENRMAETAVDYANMFDKMSDPSVRDSTLTQLAQELDSTMHSSVSKQDIFGHREEISAGVGIPGIASMIGGVEAKVNGSAFVDGSMVDQDTFETNKLVMDSLYNQAALDGDAYIDEVYRPHAQGASSQDIEKTRAGFSAEKFADYYTKYRDSMLAIGHDEIRSASDHYQDKGQPDYSDVKIPELRNLN